MLQQRCDLRRTHLAVAEVEAPISLLHDLLGEDGHLLGGGDPGLLGPGRDGEVGGASPWGEHQGRDSGGRGLGRKWKTGYWHGRGQTALSLHRDQFEHGEQDVTLSLLQKENTNENSYLPQDLYYCT